MGYGMDGRSSIPGKAQEISLHYSVPTGYGAHPASYMIIARDYFTGAKRTGREAEH
jgi:hypothetical protein